MTKLPDAILSQHIAVVGKTGSGKTSTAKLVVEQVVPTGARVCILDPVKSDWWGLISSADGKAPGLPFHVLGGPRGHVPLHDGAGKAIGELVATGALPLSIVDMADFRPGGIQRFFIDFAEALFKRMRGVVHLVIEEAHEFAPKERAGIGEENIAIHWAKKLASAGRSKGIRLVVVTQRTQSLHNALLGACDTLIAHRLTLPADQKPIIDWLKANLDKPTMERVAASLSSLKTGTGWICSGEAQLTEMRHFPRIMTYDNSATPTGDMAELVLRTAAVDQDRLRTIIGRAVEEAAANDPKALKARIAELERQAGKQGFDQAAMDAAWQGGYRAGAEAMRHSIIDKVTQPIIDDIGELRAVASRMFDRLAADVVTGVAPSPAAVAQRTAHRGPDPEVASSNLAGRSTPTFTPSVKTTDGITAAQQRVLDAVAWWRKIGQDPADRDRACVVAGYSPKASTFGVYVSQLVKMGLLETGPGKVALTDAGLRAASTPTATTRDDLYQMARALLGSQEQRVFDVVYRAWPREIRRDTVAEKVGLSPTASTAGVYMSAVAAYGLIENHSRGTVRAADWLFP